LRVLLIFPLQLLLMRLFHNLILCWLRQHRSQLRSGASQPQGTPGAC
jgi:hypothetical protein